MRWKQGQATCLKEPFQPWEEKKESGPHQCIQMSEGRVLRMDPVSSQWCQVTGQKTTTRKDAQEVPCEYKEELYRAGDWPLKLTFQRGLSHTGDIQ